MSDAVQNMIKMAKERPDPKGVSNWLIAFLGKRPLKMKQDMLNAFESEISSTYNAPADQRAATLVVKVIQKVRETVR